MEAITEKLVDIVFGVSAISFDIPALGVSLPMLEILHAILINYTYRNALRESHASIGWGQGLLATIVMAAGGGSTVAILRGDPLGILKSNRFWGIYGTTYWLMFSNPYVFQFLQYLFSIPFVEQLFTAADGVMRTSSVIRNGIEGVALNPELGQDKWVAKILCGTLSGCGGGLWVDAFRLTSAQWSFSTPRLLQTASIDMKTAFTTATFYTAMTNPTVCQILNLPLLKQEEVYAWSALIFASGIVYRSYASRWQQQQQKQITPEEEEKKDQ